MQATQIVAMEPYLSDPISDVINQQRAAIPSSGLPCL